MHKSFFATSTMPECAFAELDRVRKCLLSSFSFAKDVVVVVAVVVTREREVLPGMMKLTLWPRCRAKSFCYAE